MPGKCKFSREWLSMDTYKNWIKEEINPYKAYCRLCCVSFDISNMGKYALSSHAKSKKHMKRTASASSSMTMEGYLSRAEQPSTSSSSEPQSRPSASTSKSNDLASFTFDRSAVTRAEILWAMKVVYSHYSYHSCENVSSIFQSMFPDSDIARNFTLGEKKCSYVISYGLAPYFQRHLSECVKKNGQFVLLFDEAENKYLQQKQLDLHARFYDLEKEQVTTRYLNSAFMGHATADDLVQQFNDLTDHLPLKNLIQISMDGPSVNWSFFRKFQSLVPEANLLDIGSCGLHIVHGAFRDGCKATDWGIADYLTNIYRLFKDTPARREDFTNITGSFVFPKKFCAHRWVENLSVAMRAREVLPSIIQYINKVQTDKNYTTPQSKSYECVKSLCEPAKLLEPKLCFFISIAEQFQPFLLKYQSDEPLLAFMAEDLENMLRGLMSRLVKPIVMKEANTASKLANVDIDNDTNLLVYNKVDLGFSANKLLKELVATRKTSDRRAMEFMMDCRTWLKVSIKKLLEKCPLKQSFIRNCDCIQPRKMASDPDLSILKFQRMLVKLEACGIIKEEDCDATKREYQSFLDTVVVSENATFSSFNEKQQRLDVFLRTHVSKEKTLLWDVMKTVLTLSHGQATVERGFSVNAQVSVENRKCQSYTAQRLVHDHILCAGGIEQVDIDKGLILSVQGARQKYQHEQDNARKERSETQEDRKRKARLLEVSELREKLRRINQDIESLESSCENFAEKADKTGKREFLIKFTSLRKTLKEKRVEQGQIEANLNDLELN